MPAPDRILIAQIGAAHGVRGEVRVKSFAEKPEALRTYGDLVAEDGRRFTVERMRPAKEMLIVGFRGLNDRNAAEALNGMRLYVGRSALPDTEEDEYYHADLIGLAATGADGQTVGTVLAIHDFGAGEILEIAPPRGPSLLVPFTKEAVPEIDLAGRRMIVVPPPEAEDDDTEGEQSE